MENIPNQPYDQLQEERQREVDQINMELRVVNNIDLENDVIRQNQVLEEVQQVQNPPPVENKEPTACQHVTFLFMRFFWAVFKPRNVKTLLWRLTTVAMVGYYYYIVEGITLDTMVRNEVDLFVFIGIWHLIAMLCKEFEINRLKKREQFKVILISLIIAVVACTVILFILWPILAAFGVEIALIESNHQKLRFLFQGIYILLNVTISVLPLFTNFFFFISDGIFLSQLTCLYLVNELSMSALLVTLPFLFVVHNHFLVRGIKNYSRDMEAKKLSFVRLIGRHDATFLFVMNSLFTFFFNLVDFFVQNYAYGFNFWYLLYAYFTFEYIMDSKVIAPWFKWMSFLSVLVYTAVYCYTLTYMANPFPDRPYPLYPLAEPVEDQDAGQEL